MKNLLYQNLKCKYNINDFDQILFKIEGLPESYFQQRLFMDKMSYICEIIDLHDRIQAAYCHLSGQPYSYTFDPPYNTYTDAECILHYYANIITFIKHMAFFFQPINYVITIPKLYSIN